MDDHSTSGPASRLVRVPALAGIVTLIVLAAFLSPLARTASAGTAPDAGGRLVAWGRHADQAPTDLGNVTAIAAGYTAAFALRADGTVVGWGAKPTATVPRGLRNVVAVATGFAHAVALRRDGTVIAWGRDDHDQLDVPTGLRDVTAIATGADHTVALRSDGSVVTWGSDSDGQISRLPQAFAKPGPVVAIAAGRGHSLALLTDGSLYAWGGPDHAIEVPTALQTRHEDNLLVTVGNLPGRIDPSPVTAISAGKGHNLALRRNGTILQWGSNDFIPPFTLGATALAAGDSHNLALRGDGTVVGWGGRNWDGELQPPAGLTDVAAIAAGGMRSLAITTTPPA